MCAIKFSVKEIIFYCVERFLFLKFNTNFAQPANIDRNAIRGETITEKKKKTVETKLGLWSQHDFLLSRCVSRTMSFNPYSAATRSSIPSLDPWYSVVLCRWTSIRWEKRLRFSWKRDRLYLMLMLRYLTPSDCLDHDRSVFATIVFPRYNGAIIVSE